MREWRLRIKMSERNLEDFLIDMGYIVKLVESYKFNHYFGY